jgi:3',5'-cyclic AMP phosphodiesterase CpdA
VTALSGTAGKLLAISDLHVGFAQNRKVVEELRPTSEEDWLLLAGDVGERFADIEWALGLLKSRFATVVWVPGNHELWTVPGDPVQARGRQRYDELVAACRKLGVVTPEDPYPVWEGAGGPAVVVPLFLLYDYTFLPDGTATKEEALEQAWERGVVCSDEFLLSCDPYPSIQAWCQARLAITETRLAAVDPALPAVLVNHFPLLREHTRGLWHPEFSLWCGSVRTADWHVRYRATAVVYGHLHMPGTAHRGGVPFHEVSVGYPREWQRRSTRPGRLRQILPPHPAQPDPHGRTR